MGFPVPPFDILLVTPNRNYAEQFGLQVFYHELHRSLVGQHLLNQVKVQILFQVTNISLGFLANKRILEVLIVLVSVPWIKIFAQGSVVHKVSFRLDHQHQILSTRIK